MTHPYELALKEAGTVEWRKGDNPKIVAYFKDAGHPEVKTDETAWCAAFVGAMLKRAGLQGTGKLTARSYLDWGHPIDLTNAQPGDICVFRRGNSTWQGHVTFFVRAEGDSIICFGGNQSDQVRESAYKASDLLSIRAVRIAPSITPSRSFMGWILYMLTGGKG